MGASTRSPIIMLLLVVMIVCSLFFNFLTLTWYREVRCDCQTTSNSESSKANAATAPANPVDSTVKQDKTRRSVCDGYDGILFISHVIGTAGAGTVFFMSIVDSLLYAEKYNLYPFIHINNDRNRPCYDPNVHGVGPKLTFQHLSGSLTSVLGKGDYTCMDRRNKTAMHHPGPPDITNNLAPEGYTLVGNGLWKSYFEPVWPFPFDDESCRNKPVFEMDPFQVDKEMHRCSELAVRSWLYQGTPKALLPSTETGETVHDWLGGHRQRANRIVEKHFQLLPWMQERVNEANPNPQQCLAAHIRLTDKDKVKTRDKKGLEMYQPYIEAYANATSKDGSPIYIATDDMRVIDTIKDEWSKDISSRVIVQEGATRSDGNAPPFKILQYDKHRANTEALVEMYAMSRCSFFVHGFSGMSEAAVYINPMLHDKSVNIDDEERISPLEFAKLIKKEMQAAG